ASAPESIRNGWRQKPRCGCTAPCQKSKKAFWVVPTIRPNAIPNKIDRSLGKQPFKTKKLRDLQQLARPQHIFNRFSPCDTRIYRFEIAKTKVRPNGWIGFKLAPLVPGSKQDTTGCSVQPLRWNLPCLGFKAF
ncbi:hypothetical protein AVEN_274254-2-1, partial [Araneus ventricosus]